jgi:UDP-N-acetyl-D-glucosamine dehydrogenase
MPADSISQFARGAHIDYSDPHVPIFPKMRKHHFDIASTPINAQSLAGYDLVLIATNHDAFDYELIANNAKLIVDTRGVYRTASDKIVRA